MPFKKGHKLNIGNQYALGVKHTEDWKKQARLRMLGNTNGFKKGKPSPRKGKKASKPIWNKGLKMPQLSGENHRLWKKDRTEAMEKRRLRNTLDWKNWRKSVFNRDNYTCQECGVTKVYLEPHHIIPVRESKEKIFDLKNGITLCRPCHKKTMWKESEFAEKYITILNKR